MRLNILNLLLTTSALAAALASAAAAQEVNIEADIVALPEWHYDELYAGGLRVEELLDADVNGPTGEDIGDVENVLFSEDGRILSVIAEVGGFLELGDTHVSIPWDMVEAAEWDDGIEIPVTQESIEDFTLFRDEFLTAGDAASEVQEVEGDGPGMVGTGPRVWRAYEFIGDYARLRDGDGFVNYGYVDDLIVRDGQIAAVVVSPDVGWGTGGYYAYPYYGYGYGWAPEGEFYDLPYDRAEIGDLEPFDDDALEGEPLEEVAAEGADEVTGEEAVVE
jgi:sporulation protein YlmC with PRC-barrel domain